MKVWKKAFHVNRIEKKAKVGIIISDKINFKTKNVLKRQGDNIIIKGSIHAEYITIVNSCTPNIGAPNYIKQLLMGIKGNIHSNQIINNRGF